MKCSVKCHDQADFLFCKLFLPPFSSAFSLVKQHIWTAQPQPKPHLQSVSPSSLLHLNFSLHTSSCKIFSRASTPTVTWCLSLWLVFPFLLLLLQQSFLLFPVDMPCYVVQIPSYQPALQHEAFLPTLVELIVKLYHNYQNPFLILRSVSGWNICIAWKNNFPARHFHHVSVSCWVISLVPPSHGKAPGSGFLSSMTTRHQLPSLSNNSWKSVVLWFISVNMEYQRRESDVTEGTGEHIYE